jgi:uncharacterized membrane protein YcgQ (UPF0703/DUF1980 family)
MRAILFILFFLFSWQTEAGAETNQKSFCYLKDRLFVQQVKDIYLNPQNYKDKIIQIEGFFGKYSDGKQEYYEVYRRTAGCCGDDGKAGFEFVYKAEKLSFKPDEWILVEAHVATEKIETYDRVYLKAISVIKKEKGNLKDFVL